MNNLERLRESMAQAGVPALLVSDHFNVLWLTGFTGSFGVALTTATEAIFLTDSRYAIQAEEQVASMPTATFRNPTKFEDFLIEQARKLGISQLAFETSLRYSEFKRYSACADVSWVEAPELFAPLRMIKQPHEIEAVRKACGLAEAVLERTLRLVQPGVTEIDILLDLEFHIKRQGAGVAFPPIVVSGSRSARPHGVPSEKKLEPGDFLTIDFGATVDGYHSDITRTYVVQEASERQRKMYEKVLEAQVAACAALKPGSDGRDIDRLARDILAEADLEQYFGHGLGHGLGLEVHDPGRLSPTTSQPIEDGQVWTVEPGVYIEGFGGVRIEDDVLVTAHGPELLTSAPKGFQVLG